MCENEMILTYQCKHHQKIPKTHMNHTQPKILTPDKHTDQSRVCSDDENNKLKSLSVWRLF